MRDYIVEFCNGDVWRRRNSDPDGLRFERLGPLKPAPLQPEFWNGMCRSTVTHSVRLHLFTPLTSPGANALQGKSLMPNEHNAIAGKPPRLVGRSANSAKPNIGMNRKYHCG